MTEMTRFELDFDGRSGETVYRQIRSDLARAARRWLRRDGVSQVELERRLGLDRRSVGVGSGDSGPRNLDLLVRSLLALGATRRDIALEIVRSMPSRE